MKAITAIDGGHMAAQGEADVSKGQQRGSGRHLAVTTGGSSCGDGIGIATHQVATKAILALSS